MNDINTKQWNVYGVEVYNRGNLVHSYGNTLNCKYPVYSATKTVLSLAVGIAYDEGKIDLFKSILDYLPEKIISSMSKDQIATFQMISIERLLTMSVDGLPFRPEVENFLNLYTLLSQFIHDVQMAIFMGLQVCKCLSMI